jgi:hypoxanthine phosphoribosyltransferase
MDKIVEKEYDHWLGTISKKEVLYLTWDHVTKLVDTLEAQIRHAKQHYELIAGITRGGLIPAIMLSHRLKLPMMAITSRTLIPISKRCLVIDEIYDTGATIAQLKYINPGIHVGVLFHNESLPNLDYFAVKDPLQKWIVFPWEKQHEKAN